jgi:hypothetical protein
MSLTNYVFIITGSIVIIITIISLFYLRLKRIISCSGKKTMQPIIVIVIGLIFIFIGFIIEVSKKS